MELDANPGEIAIVDIVESRIDHNVDNYFVSDKIDNDDYFPRCFDISNAKDYDDFVEYYRILNVENFLKKFVMYCDSHKFDRSSNLYKTSVTKLEVALKIIKRKLMDTYDYIRGNYSAKTVTNQEWKYFYRDENIENDPVLLEIIKEKKWANTNNVVYKKEVPKIEVDARQTLKQLYEECPQTSINGYSNIWILKPAGLSRGRGIKLTSSLTNIEAILKSAESNYVVQKYIESPALIEKRKFDIRQWVLITDFNPLSIWFYEECYIRFSFSDYTQENIHDNFIHLTNNSVNKNAGDGRDLFWTMEQLADYLKELKGYDYFRDVIKPRMKELVINSIQSTQDLINNRKSSSEIYGYDFCFDSDQNVWLIEVNSSPAFDFSSDVTEKLIKSASEDYIKVVIDRNIKYNPNASESSDTGLFTRIYKSKYIVKNSAESMGINLSIEGHAISNSLLKQMTKHNV